VLLVALWSRGGDGGRPGGGLFPVPHVEIHPPLQPWRPFALSSFCNGALLPSPTPFSAGAKREGIGCAAGGASGAGASGGRETRGERRRGGRRAAARGLAGGGAGGRRPLERAGAGRAEALG
jgi:hypothetical protein